MSITIVYQGSAGIAEKTWEGRDQIDEFLKLSVESDLNNLFKVQDGLFVRILSLYMDDEALAYIA